MIFKSDKKDLYCNMKIWIYAVSLNPICSEGTLEHYELNENF